MLTARLPDAYGDIDSIAIMKWHLNGSQSNSRSPFLMVQLDPGITVFSPWITDPSILENGEDDLGDLFFWQSAFRVVTFRARRAIASDHRGRFWYGSAEDRAYCWVNEDRTLVCNRRGDCRAAPDPQVDRSNYHGTDLSRLGPMNDVALAQATSCAAQRNGEVICWGDLRGYGRPDRSMCANAGGRPPGEHSTERQIQDLEDIVAVSAGDYAFLALAMDGVVYEWGWDWRLEELIQRPEFYEFDEPVTRITNAVQTRCVLLESGRVGCWGLHNGSPDGPSGRVHWLNLPPVKELSDGWSSHHVCALTVDDEVFCWGRNEHNQLGDGSYEDQLEPVYVSEVPPPLRR